MADDRQNGTRDAIIGIVLELLEAEGYDGVKLRDVARRAGASLTTIYKLFPTREALIVAALSHWSEQNVYSRLADPAPESLSERLRWLSRKLFEPYHGCPRILEAYHRARLGPGGEALDVQGFEAVRPVAERWFEDLDPGYAEDLILILDHFHRGLVTRLASGSLSNREALELLDRAVLRLTHDSEAFAARRQPISRRARGIDPS